MNPNTKISIDKHVDLKINNLLRVILSSDMFKDVHVEHLPPEVTNYTSAVGYTKSETVLVETRSIVLDNYSIRLQMMYMKEAGSEYFYYSQSRVSLKTSKDHESSFPSMYSYGGEITPEQTVSRLFFNLEMAIGRILWLETEKKSYL